MREPALALARVCPKTATFTRVLWWGPTARSVRIRIFTWALLLDPVYTLAVAVTFTWALASDPKQASEITATLILEGRLVPARSCPTEQPYGSMGRILDFFTVLWKQETCKLVKSVIFAQQ